MKKITIIVYEDVRLSAVSVLLDILESTNTYLNQLGEPPAFEISLLGGDIEPDKFVFSRHYQCLNLLTSSIDPDIILIPAFIGSPEIILEKHRNIVKWIKSMHSQGKEIAGFCYGSYFLAKAGILSGKRCTSHWTTIEDMKQKFPDIKILPDEIITEHDGVYTSGGAILSLNLLIYLIEKFCGREVSIAISKYFSIDIGLSKQTQFSVFQGQRGHQDQFIQKAQDFILEKYTQPITVENIADEVNMSKRNLIRRFKKATLTNPSEFLQRVRIEAAKRILEKTSLSINELVFEVGFGDAKTLRKSFKRFTGMSPLDYRKRYGPRN